MKLYLVEAHLEDEGHYLREWVASQGDAASKRAALMKAYGLPRKAIRTTALEIDTRKDGLLVALNHTTNRHASPIGDGDAAFAA